LTNRPRAPQRNFVVGYKARRSTKENDTSIWKGMDLKGLARAVEDDMPALAARQVDGLASTEPDVTAAISGAATEPRPKVPAASEEVPAEATPSQPVLAMHEPVQIGSEASHPTADKRTRRQRKAHSPLTTARRLGTSIVNPVSEQFEVEVDDLDRLEAENRRLKTLLVKTLQVENEHMSALLQRYR
jgi:hypothetical protein